MTLNNVINRIKATALAHNQVRNFYQGMVTDFLADKTTLYPSVFLQDTGGSISLAGHATTLTYRLFLLDLVNVSANTSENEQDVQSDMVSVAMDLLAQMNASNYSDWRISPDNTLQLVAEYDNDMVAGCVIDISIRIQFNQNICDIPGSEIGYDVADTIADRSVFDYNYTATGAEGLIITLPATLIGKKILLVTREHISLHRVSNLPDSLEYVANGTTLALGADAQAGERFLILYRNY